MQEIDVPREMLQKRMHLQAVPPPEANSPRWWGDHASARTAAVWPMNLYSGGAAAEERGSQTHTLPSFPPEAKNSPSGDQWRPQISSGWPPSLVVESAGFNLTSCSKMPRSRLPVASTWPFQDSAPTRREWPGSVRIRCVLWTSQSWTSPLCRPTARTWGWWEVFDQLSEVHVWFLSVHNLSHRFVRRLRVSTTSPRATASTSSEELSRQLR
mmetsp:Transcript_71270/g.231601  ORF Transcript_71270/g.231601 Transcript_71270/m.231601 type:complete len:212 (+) Transcript_71270:446-1081(+)